jgi:hypothetical protein
MDESDLSAGGINFDDYSHAASGIQTGLRASVIPISGRNGGAVADVLRRKIPELIEGREADDPEAIWHHVWWALHYGGRGGPAVLALSALDTRCGT